jgi:hypothetical protein
MDKFRIFLDFGQVITLVDRPTIALVQVEQIDIMIREVTGYHRKSLPGSRGVVYHKPVSVGQGIHEISKL